MHVLSLKRLRDLWEKYPDAEGPLKTWYKLVSQAVWEKPADIKAMFGTADFVGDNRVIFDIGGNKYRIVARIAYKNKRVMIKFADTHKEYDKITAETVS